MKVKVFKDINNPEEFELESIGLLQCLNLLKLQKDNSYVLEIMSKPFKFILFNSENNKEFVYTSETVHLPFPFKGDLYIIPEISGNAGLSALLVAGLAAAGVTGVAATIIADIAIVLLATGVSMGINAIITALTPTHTAKHLTSYNFSSLSINVTEGGPVPITVGTPFCGGTQISSAISSSIS